MRRILILALLATALGASAQEPPDRRPPKLEPLPEAPPPPGPPPAESAIEPQVTITTREGATVEEYRANGRLYAMKVTPAVGAPYWLIDYRGDGTFTRLDHLDTGLRVPQWVILEF